MAEHIERKRTAVENAGPRGPFKNAHLAGTVHPVTGVPFNADGYAVFDGIAEVELPSDLIGPTVTDTAQMQYATRVLRNQLSIPGVADQFTPAQLDAIQAGSEKIPGLTWHHREDGVTLELVDEATHARTGHAGGREVTGGRP